MSGRLIGFALCFTCVISWCASEFVMPKRSNLKKKIGTTLTQMVSDSADIIALQVQLQKECIDKTYELIEEEAASWFKAAETKKLVRYNEQLSSLQEEIQQYTKKIQARMRELKDLSAT